MGAFLRDITLNEAGQVLGLLLSAVGFFIYSAKTRRGILSAKLICDVGYAVQNFMIGAPTGALINLISVARELVFYRRGSKRWASHRIWLYLFVALMGFAPLITWMGIVSLLPSIGSAVAVFAFYCREPHHTRIIGIFSMIPWLIYCVVIPNYGVFLTTVIQLVAAVFGLIRDHREKRRREGKRNKN